MTTETQLHESVVKRKKRRTPEDDLQKAIVFFLQHTLPDGAVFHHSPNESKASIAWRKRLKEMGLHPNWPDLEILYRGRMIFIEVKAPGRYPTKGQKACHEELRLAGAVVTVCHSLPAVQTFLEQLMPLRARVAA